MRGIKIEGIILKRKNLGEADRILTVFTHQRGKITVLAKGVRRITSRRSGNVELLNRAVMYLHPGKNFLILTEATAINTYQKLKENLLFSSTAFHLIEITDRLTAENQESAALYENLVHVLQRLEQNPRQIFIRAYEAKILSNQGFVNFGDFREFGKIGEILKKIEMATWDKIEKIKVNQKQALELEQVLQYHVERVIEGRLKSRQLLKRI